MKFKTSSFVKTLLSLMVIFSLFITSSLGGVVSATQTSLSNSNLDSSDSIIGGSYEVQPYPGNWIVLDWQATEDEIIIYVQNIGIDTVDALYGTVNIVTTGDEVSFSATHLAPLVTKTITVECDMTKCFEEIVVEYYAIDSGSEVGAGSSPGEREIPSSLSTLWGRGTFSSVYASINYHFGKHGSEVGATNIVAYARKASEYANSVIYDIDSLSQTELTAKYTVTESSGATPSHKYKHRVNKLFVILADSNYNILSFGK